MEVGSDLLGIVEILEPGFSLKRGRIRLEQLEFKLAKIIGIINIQEKLES